MKSIHSDARRPRLLFINRSYWPEVEADLKQANARQQ